MSRFLAANAALEPWNIWYPSQKSAHLLAPAPLSTECTFPCTGTPLKRVHISLHRHPSQQSAHFIAPAPLSKECTFAFTQLTLSKVWISQKSDRIRTNFIKTDQIQTKFRKWPKCYQFVWFWRLPLRRCQKNFYCWFLAPCLPTRLKTYAIFSCECSSIN